MTHDIGSAASSFVESYREAFERKDVAAILGHFGYELHVASDTGATVTLDVVAGADLRRTIEQLINGYRERDVARVQVRATETMIISARLAAVKVAWALFNRRDEPLAQFNAMYTLAYTSGSVAIVAIAHDETAR